MGQLRKPSSITYGPPTASIESRFRGLFTKWGVVYGCTVLIILLFLSLAITGVPDTSEVSSIWPSMTDYPIPKPLPIKPPTKGQHGTPENPDEFPSLPPLPPEEENHPDHYGKQTKEGLPLISTNNGGKVVLLTGATGPGNFDAVEGFYSKIVNNRLDYANLHSQSPFLHG